MVPVKYDRIILGGGYDTETPTLSLKPGVCREAINFECSVTGGYTRIGGYERHDGRTAPSSAALTVLAVTITTVPTLGSTLTGNSSSATGVICGFSNTTISVTNTTGTFTSEQVKIGAVVIGNCTGFSTVADAATLATQTAAAADVYRALISAPTGSGALRGAFILSDNVYAFRNNAGGTACNMWKATTGGWTQVNFEYEISFTAGGNVAPADGATLTQGGVTATVRRVVRQSGAWVGTPGTAVGRLVISAPAGGNFAAGAATLTGGVNVTLSAIQTAITLQPNGKFDVEIGNFAGNASTIRAYGVDGKNRAWEFDGSYFVPISTGATTDTPKYIAIHKNHLFLSINSSMMHSAPGLPFDFTALSGAAEIAVGDVITGMLVQPGSQATAAMACYTNNSTLMLYGTSATSSTSPWNLVAFNTGTGAADYTAQNMAQSYALDNRGVIGMQTTLNFGNFDQSTLTANILKWIKSKVGTATCSVLNREKSQYRVFYSDGSALYLTMVNGNLVGSMPVKYPTYMYQSSEWTKSDGTLWILGCGSDGMLYRLDSGTSFDGAAIPASITLNFNPTGSPRTLKRYRKCALEMQGSSYAEIQFYYSLGYSAPDYTPPTPVSYGKDLSSAKWDGGTWDKFFWDSRALAPQECEMTGTAENVALTFFSSSNAYAPFTLNSAVIHYSIRRGMR